MKQPFGAILNIFISFRSLRVGDRGMDHKQNRDEDEGMRQMPTLGKISDKERGQGVCPWLSLFLAGAPSLEWPLSTRVMISPRCLLSPDPISHPGSPDYIPSLDPSHLGMWVSSCCNESLEASAPHSHFYCICTFICSSLLQLYLFNSSSLASTEF